MNEAINGLAERMAKDGGDLEGWVLLGRAYKSTQRYAEAADALAKAQALAPQDPNIMVERAEVIALTDPDRRIAGQARGLLEQALLAQPENQRAMWLMGISNVQAGEYEQAVTIWERLLPLLPPGENVTESVREQIAQARAHAGMPPAAGAAAPVAVSAAPEPSATPTDATGATKLVVEIDIAPELKAQLGANDVLYVFARAPQGPKMPLAIQRMPVSSFPVTVTLDDSMGMMPSMKLSSVPEVVVGARVSKTGVANAQSGDFEVISAPVTLATQSATLKLTINSVVP
jgi:cytochrome c-type biogenesis protein CcmH